MKNTDPEKIPSKFYVIVYQCENLPDLRTEKEKKKGKISSWQVIFPDAKETLASSREEGSSKVCWMVECFLTLKQSSTSFSITVIDDKSRKAGTITLALNDIPIGDKENLKPGQKYEGFREAYRNMSPIQTKNLQLTNTIISYWIWTLDFREFKKSSSNLQKLKTFSKSATNLFKNSNLVHTNFETKQSENPYVNPFESEYEIENKYTNPFGDEDEFDGELDDKVGNSSFTNIELPKFRNSIWFPKEINTEQTNPFYVKGRASSLPGLNEISKDLTSEINTEIEDYKKHLMNQELSLGVSENELKNLNTLSEIYENKRSGQKNSELNKVMDEEFFSLLNDLRRQFANNILKVKSLEIENKELTDELSELRKKFYTVKTKLINEGMSRFLQDI